MRLHWPIVNHGREADFVPEAEAAGARVKVVAGGYGGVKSGPPLDQFVSPFLLLYTGLGLEKKNPPVFYCS